MFLEIGPPFIEQGFINVNELNRWAVQKPIANLNRFRMIATPVKKRHCLIKDVRS